MNHFRGIDNATSTVLKNALFEILVKRYIEVLNTEKCLNCDKNISYKVLGSIYCVDCNMRYNDYIRNLKDDYGHKRHRNIINMENKRALALMLFGRQLR